MLTFNMLHQQLGGATGHRAPDLESGDLLCAMCPQAGHLHSVCLNALIYKVGWHVHLVRSFATWHMLSAE